MPDAPLSQQRQAVEAAARLMWPGEKMPRPSEREFLRRNLEAAVKTLRAVEAAE